MGFRVGVSTILVGLLTVASPAGASIDDAGALVGNAVSSPVADDLVAHPGRFVIELTDEAGHHEHDHTPSLSAGERGRAVAEANRRAAEVAREIEFNRARSSRSRGGSSGKATADDFGIEAGGAVAGNGLTIHYSPTYPTPTVARPAINAAVDSWNQRLATNGAPVVVEVNWVSLGNPALLGFAGPSDFFTGGNLPTGHLYPAALTNVLGPVDANGSAKPEVIVVINADLAASGDWHYGSGAPGWQQVDLQSVVTHEIGHGLGFVSSANNDAGPIRFESPPFIYDAQALYRGTPVVSLADIGAALTSNNVDIAISNTQRGSLHTPASWVQGTSFSHFENSGEQHGTLMTPSLLSGQANRSIDGFTLGVLRKMGWPSPATPISPLIDRTTVDGPTVWVDWRPDNRSSGLPADVFRLEAYRDGSLAAAFQFSGAQRSGGLGRLQPNTTYRLQLVPVRGGVRGSPTIRNVTTGPAAVLTPPSTPPPFVRHKALDGQIFRVYQAHLLRVPDRQGFDFWLDQRARGATLLNIIAGFQTGSEFTNRYGSLTDWQFVGLIYRNVLGREPDSSGLNHWVNTLRAGSTRAEVMAGFVEGAEYIKRTSTVGPHSSTEGSIRRLYQAFFLREPTAANLDYWVSIANGGASLQAIADQFVVLPEFRNRYGSLNDAAFVNLVYQNVLDRAADPNGFNHWLTQLGAGMSRGTMMVGFSESVEFIKRTGTIP